MPYIKNQFNFHVKEIASVGELNYMITNLLLQYIQENGESYKSYNDCIGGLECCKLEFYRRAVAIYEDLKRFDNGDVYK